MACVNCKKIRSAILHGKMAEAAGLTVEALREKVGLKAAAPSPDTSRVAAVGKQAPEVIALAPTPTKGAKAK